MKLPRPTRTTLIFSLCLIALASVLAYENHQLSLVSNNLASTADKDSLNALLTRLAKVDERLDAVDGKHLVTNDDFRSGQQALSNRIDDVQTYAKQASETTQDLSLRVTAAEEQVMVLTFCVRMVILTMTIPLFLLAGFTGLVDGLVRRDLRKFGSGRESSYLYHKARGAIIPLMIVPWTVYLAMPLSVSPFLILGPCAVLLGMSVYITVSSFKKYL